MTNDSARQNAWSRLRGSSTLAEEGDTYAAYQLGAYYGEVIPNLVFRFKDGTRIAKAYHWPGEVTYEPGFGLRLVYADAVFTIRGRNLLEMFVVISNHSVKQIWEADRATAFLVPETDALVEAIERTARYS